MARHYNWRGLKIPRKAVAARELFGEHVALMFAETSDVELADLCNAVDVKCDDPGWVHYTSLLGMLCEIERRRLARESAGERWTRRARTWLRAIGRRFTIRHTPRVHSAAAPHNFGSNHARRQRDS